MSDAPLASIVLCRPQHPGNIGSVSRAMANFGYTQLYLVQPPPGWRHDDALLHMANGYTECLDRAVVVDDLAEFGDHLAGLIGFTRRAGTNRPIHGELEDAATRIAETRRPERYGLVFGNERTGLLNEELDHCDALYTIATSKSHGSLNLSLATGLVMYQLSRRADAIAPHADGSELKPLDIISATEATQRANEILDTLSVSRVFVPGTDFRESSELYLRRILMRARLSPFESNWLKRMTMRVRPYLRDEPNA
ncbi:MAG: RNA methyltransferase [Proteobacteria bacterium]|nr:RNA methyltransferase [Pseudomonadota bacterium]MCP4922099.1 RNA methyltransferase [Pseudomonadota bacterium]